MANRTFDWGESDQEANKRMRAHAEAWPAAAKQVDEFTAIIVAGFGDTAAAQADDDGDGQEESVAAKVKTENPSPELQARIDDPIEAADDAKFPARPGRKMEAGEARGVLLAQLSEWARAGRQEFATKDLRPVRERTGLSRSWFIGQLNLLADDGVIERDDERRCYRIVRADVLLGELAGV